MSHCTHLPIDVNQMLQTVSGAQHGGVAAFLGSVRAGQEDGPVTRIEYTAYEAMLDEEFRRIIEESAQQWPDTVVSAVHRLGAVPTGEVSIAVIAGSPHRAEAFAACRHVIEEAKRRLPVWKKEILADGRAAWRPNRIEESSSLESSAEAVPPS